jgi:hypothetical protein
MDQKDKEQSDSREAKRLRLLKACKERQLDVPDEIGKDLDRLKAFVGQVALQTVDEDLSFEDGILRVFSASGMITRDTYDRVLERLKIVPHSTVGEALHECGEITPELATTLNDGQILVDRGIVTIQQFTVALFDNQTLDVPVKKSLTKRGWLKE